MTQPPERQPVKPDYQTPPRRPLEYAGPAQRRRWTTGTVVLIVLLSLLGAAALLCGACYLSFHR